VTVELQVETDEESAARACAERLADAAKRGAAIVLAGGSTPERAYELASELEPDWSRVRLWWGDERCVAPEHEWSNFGVARRALLDRLERPPAEVYRIEGELGAEDAASRYESDVSGAEFDLVLLGLGPDGHVASLYPNAPGLNERARWAIPAEAKLQPFVERVTLTIPALESAPELVFLVGGEDKAEAAEKAFTGPPDPGTPGSLVRSRTGRTVAIVDRAAARRLA
jgi:6-phosphogluconolactonase